MLEDIKNEVAQRKLRTCETLQDYDSFVDSSWYYDPSMHGMMPEIGYVGLALAGEAGEAAEKVKKFYRDAAGVENFGSTTALMKELGDVLYYLTKLAHLHGNSLDDVARANVKKLKDRAARGEMRGSGDER